MLDRWCLKLLLRQLLLFLIFFGIFRVIATIVIWPKIEDIENLSTWLLKTYWTGLRFDLVIFSYLVSLWVLILTFSKNSSLLRKVGFYSHQFLVAIAMVIACSDIPYFIHYHERFHLGAFLWLESNTKFVIDMVMQEPRFGLYPVLAFCLLYFLHHFFSKKNFLNFEKQLLNFSAPKLSIKTIALSVLVMGLVALGARGRIAKKSPIRIGNAIISPYPLVNNLGLNPVFTLLKSYLNDKKYRDKELMPTANALKNVERIFPSNRTGNSPVSRVSTPAFNFGELNVVLILMESMSAHKTGFLRNQPQEKSLTPFLDELSQKSISFSNYYTSGIHTYAGIFSSLFSHPVTLKKHAMKRYPVPVFQSLPYYLKKKNFRNFYIISHDPQFDNAAGFLRANHFDRIYSINDYPSDKVLSTLGVPDHQLLHYSLSFIGEQKKLHPGKKFFATIKTSSDHGPYILPKNISLVPKSTKIKRSIVEYADWSLKQFFKEAQNQDWFNQTLFVLTADHGAALDTQHSLPISYLHSPLLFYTPGGQLKAQSSDKLASQLDISPSILSTLGIEFENNAFGVDLFSEEREFVYFSSDNRIGVVDEKHYLLYNPYRQSSELNPIDSSVEWANEANGKAKLIEKMKNYALSQMESSRWMINNKKTFLKKESK